MLGTQFGNIEEDATEFTRDSVNPLPTCSLCGEILLQNLSVTRTQVRGQTAMGVTVLHSCSCFPQRRTLADPGAGTQVPLRLRLPLNFAMQAQFGFSV